METLLTLTCDEAQLKGFAAALAPRLQAGDCVALSGDLGVGKSTFARHFIWALAGPVDVPSPTFTLVQPYETSKGPLAHFDLYRLKRPDDVYELGFEDALHDGMTLIEWPERAGNLLPASHLAIRLEFAQHQPVRHLTLKGLSAWAVRLAPLIQQFQNALPLS